MKIRTQLIVSMVFFVAVIAIISASVISTNQQVERLNKQEELAKNIELKVGDLGYLSNDYLLYHEKPQIDRWEAKYSSLSADVSNLTVDVPEQRVLVNNIRTNQLRLKDIIGDIILKIAAEPTVQQSAVDPGFIQVSSSRIGVQTQGIVFDASRLAQMLRDEADRIKQQNNLLIFALIGAFLAFLLSDYLLIFRGALKSISNLRAGTKVIGSGNLDYSIAEKNGDEIGELAQAFNLMTTNLKAVTASKADLEKEIVERKQAEVALRESEEKFSTMFHATPVATVLATVPEGRVHDVNEAYLQLTGFKSKEEALGKTSEELGLAQDEEARERILEEFRQNGVVSNSEMTFRDSAGLERTVLVGLSPIDIGGRRFLISTNLDITERKRIEAESERLASFPQINPNPIIEVDLEGCVHFLNLAANKMVPNLKDKECSLNHPWLTDWEQVVQIFRKSGTSTYVRDIFAGDRWYQQSMHLVPSTQRIRIYGLDITERKQAEVEIQKLTVSVQQEKDRLLTLVNSIPDEVWFADSHKKIALVNPAVLNEFGSDTFDNPEVESIAGSSEVYRPDGTPRPVDEAPPLRALRGEVIRNQVEIVKTPASGEIRYRQVNAAPVKDADGNIIGSVSVVRDITDHKRADEERQSLADELSDRVAELQAVMDSAPVAVWIAHDPQCQRITGNAYADQILQAPPGGNVSRSALPGDAAVSYRVFREGVELKPEDMPAQVATATGKPVMGDELELIFPDGRTVYLIESARPLFDVEGQVRGAVIAGADVTQIKQAEEGLKAINDILKIANVNADQVTLLKGSVDYLKDFSHCAAIGIRLLDEEGNIPYQAYEGFSQSFYDRESPISIKSDQCMCINVIKGDVDPKLPFYTDGGSFYMNDTTRFLATVSEEDKGRTRNVCNQVGFESVALVPIRFERTILGLIQLSDPRENMVPLNMVEVVEKIAMQLGTAIVRVKAQQALKESEVELRKAKDGLERRVQERTAELSDAKENLEAINEELQVEISEHENTEKDLLKAKEVAETAVEAKAAFLANMSHELRTPMNAVIGFSNLLMDESLTPDQKDYIERIRSGGEVLLSLINDILDFSKMEKKKAALEHHPLSLRALADESMDMVAVQARDKGLDLGVTISYGIPDTIIGDHGRLRQILINLLTNAVKFTDAGGVYLSISSKALDEKKHQILFEVSDTGIGIPENKIDLLFQPFSQVEATISNHRGGTGLGLAISKRLVELMGGKIWVESEQGKGSIFRFYIDAEIAQTKGELVNSKKPRAADENLAEKKPMRILVAEDVPSNQKVLVEMLRRMGYRADMAADGFEVLQALERQPYDLILMDVKMPEMDGIAAAKEIRKLWPNNGPKIVAITAYAMEGDREKCLEAGMNDYIAKPVKKGELAEVLRNIALAS